MPDLEAKFNQLTYAFNQEGLFLLVTHIRPDIDATGSTLALYYFLKQKNKEVIMFVNDKLPPEFSYLPFYNLIENDFFNIKNLPVKNIIFLDCGDFKRGGLEEEFINQKQALTINIDHHLSNPSFAQINLIDNQSSSTAEILYNYFDFIKYAINPKVAQCLLSGIAGDTNFLYHSNTSQHTTEAFSDLIQKGAKPQTVLNKVYSEPSMRTLKVTGKALARLKLNQQESLATTALFVEDYEDLGLDPDQPLFLDAYLNSLNDVKATLVLKDSGDGYVKGSYRTTREDVDVAEMAAKYGGGGHRKAAGFKIKGRVAKGEKGWKVENQDKTS